MIQIASEGHVRFMEANGGAYKIITRRELSETVASSCCTVDCKYLRGVVDNLGVSLV